MVAPVITNSVVPGHAAPAASPMAAVQGATPLPAAMATATATARAVRRQAAPPVRHTKVRKQTFMVRPIPVSVAGIIQKPIAAQKSTWHRATGPLPHHPQAGPFVVDLHLASPMASHPVVTLRIAAMATATATAPAVRRQAASPMASHPAATLRIAAMAIVTVTAPAVPNPPVVPRKIMAPAPVVPAMYAAMARWVPARTIQGATLALPWAGVAMAAFAARLA